MLPIPKAALPSIARVRVPEETEDGYQAYSEPRTIVNVRYELAAGLRNREYQLQDSTTGVLYVDAVNSHGAFDVPAGSLVRIDGAETECCVSVCKPFKTLGGHVHHWEIELK